MTELEILMAGYIYIFQSTAESTVCSRIKYELKELLTFIIGRFFQMFQ